MDSLTIPLEERCLKCGGSGIWRGSKMHDGHPGLPCRTCLGTGRRDARHAGNGHDIPPAVVTAGHKSAAEKMAEALAELAGNAAVDEQQVRDIIRSEFVEEGNALSDMVTQTKVRLDKLIADVEANIPRRLEIVVDGEVKGELPALRHRCVESLLMTVRLGIPAYVVGPAGSGKTTAAHQVANALGLPFYMQGAMSGSHEILGFIDAHGRYQTTAWRQAFEHGGVMLLDEIDASDVGALLAANAGIANGHMTFPDRAEPVKRHADFRLIAAANTFGLGSDRQYVGRNQLDAASLNRFAFIDWPYDERLENQLTDNGDWTVFVQQVRRAVDKLKIRHVVSPRQTQMGASLLRAGMGRSEVERIVVWQGLTRADVSRVQEAM